MAFPTLEVLLKSKIHRATVTHSNINYVGSCGIDEDLMEFARIKPNEQIHVVNVNNGERIITYAIPAPRGSGTISINGAAARKAVVGDIVIIIAYAMFDPSIKHEPTIVHVNSDNNVSNYLVGFGLQ